MFCTIGTMANALNVVNRHFKPLLKCAGLRDIRWHDSRRTCATLLQGRRVHPKLPLDTLYGKTRRGEYWRGLGIKSTAAKPLVSALRVLDFLRYLQVKRRADERTRTAFLISLRVIFTSARQESKAEKEIQNRADHKAV